MADNKSLRTFYYNPIGMDNEGNFGALPTDPGWIVVAGRDANSAIARLPLVAKKKVSKVHAKFKAKPDPEYGDFSDFESVMECSAGWGLGFSFLNEEDWSSLVEEWSADETL